MIFTEHVISFLFNILTTFSENSARCFCNPYSYLQPNRKSSNALTTNRFNILLCTIMEVHARVMQSNNYAKIYRTGNQDYVKNLENIKGLKLHFLQKLLTS